MVSSWDLGPWAAGQQRSVSEVIACVYHCVKSIKSHYLLVMAHGETSRTVLRGLVKTGFQTGFHSCDVRKKKTSDEESRELCYHTSLLKNTLPYVTLAPGLMNWGSSPLHLKTDRMPATMGEINTEPYVSKCKTGFNWQNKRRVRSVLGHQCWGMGFFLRVTWTQALWYHDSR